MVGLETSLALTLTELVAPGHLSLARAIELLSVEPARLLGLNQGGPLAPSRPAHVVVFDPNSEWTVVPARLRSLCKNTPFGGRVLKGRVLHTFFGGRATVRDGIVHEKELV